MKIKAQSTGTASANGLSRSAEMKKNGMTRLKMGVNSLLVGWRIDAAAPMVGVMLVAKAARELLAAYLFGGVIDGY